MPQSAAPKVLSESLSFTQLDILNEFDVDSLTPEEVDESLGMGRRWVKQEFRFLTKMGLLDWQGREGKPGTTPHQRVLYQTKFFLSPMGRMLMGDEEFHSTALGNSLSSQ